MKNTPIHRAQWVEALEDRRLMSATPLNVVGAYTGVGHDSNERYPSTMTVVISSGTSHGDITGYVESKFPHQSMHINEFSGIVRGDTLNINTGTTVVIAHDVGGIITGSYVFASDGDSSVGSFVLNKVRS